MRKEIKHVFKKCVRHAFAEIIGAAHAKAYKDAVKALHATNKTTPFISPVEFNEELNEGFQKIYNKEFTKIIRKLSKNM